MNITIDSGLLLSKIEEFNPGLDLTGIKAYLFDLMMGTPPSASVKAKAPVNRPSAPVNPVESEEDASGFFDEDEVLNKMMGRESTVGGKPAVSAAASPGKKTLTPLEKKAQRDEKRSNRVDFSAMSGKEVMEHITAQSAPKKKDGQTQFVDMGSDESGGGDTGGDISLG